MRGFLTLELLIALLLASVALMSAALVAWGAPNVVADARLHREGTWKAEELLGSVMAASEGDPALAVSKATSTSSAYEASLASVWTGPGASRSIAALVAWNDARAKTHTFRLTTLLIDYEHPDASPCDPLPEGDWTRPVSSSFGAGVAFPALASVTGDASHIVAVASTTASVGAPDLFVLTRETGTLVGSFDSATTTKTGAAGAILHDSYLYLANAGTCSISLCGALSALSLADPSHPVVVAYAGGSAPGRSLAYADERLYLGLEKNAGPEFLIFDVTDPAKPNVIGSAEIGFSVNDIVLSPPYAYLATTDNRGVGKGVQAFDVSEPETDMVPARSTVLPGVGFMEALAIAGDTLYVGRSAASNSKELYALNPNDLSPLPGALDLSASVVALIPRGFLLAVLTRTELRLFDMTEPDRPALFSQSLSFPGATASVCVGDTLYIARRQGTAGILTAVRGS